MNRPEILIIGSTGRVGSELISLLTDAGLNLRVLVRKTSAVKYAPPIPFTGSNRVRDDHRPIHWQRHGLCCQLQRHGCNAGLGHQAQEKAGLVIHRIQDRKLVLPRFNGQFRIDRLSALRTLLD